MGGCSLLCAAYNGASDFPDRVYAFYLGFSSFVVRVDGTIFTRGERVVVCNVNYSLYSATQVTGDLNNPRNSAFTTEIFNPTRQRTLKLSRKGSSPLDTRGTTDTTTSFTTGRTFLGTTNANLTNPFTLYRVRTIQLRDNTPRCHFSNNDTQ